MAISLNGANDPYELLIASMIAIEREPQTRLIEEKTETERLKTVMNDADSKISALHGVLKRLTDALASPFEARSATQPTSGEFSVTASDDTAFSSHTVQVARLAKADTRISNQLTASGGTLRSFFDSNGGAQTFSISVAHPIDTDPTNRVAVSVTVTPAGTTDEEIMDEISAAVGSAMDQAVTAGTITSSEKANASVVNETTTTARLSLRSGQTGFNNRLMFTDSAGGLLATLGLTNNVVASGTSGGQVTAVGTSETDSELNSKIVLDGLTLYRDSNQITDALDGITLQLNQVTTTAMDFTVEPGADTIQQEVQDFIDKYNDVLTYIQEKSAIDTTNYVRGDLAGDQAFRSLRFGMRNDVSGQVTGQPVGAPSFLSELGIEVGDDGTLSLADADKLVEAVKDNSDAVQSFFAGTDGIATRLMQRVDQYTGVNGIIDSRTDLMDSTIKRLSDQIDTWDDRMLRREDQLRVQFAKLQEAIALLQGQQQTFLSYFGGF